MSEITEVSDEVVKEKFGDVDELFKTANKSESGVVTSQEAVEFFPQFGLSVLELGEIWNRTSVNKELDKHGFIDYLKFIHVSQENLKEIFDVDPGQKEKISQQFEKLQENGIISAEKAYNFLVKSKLPREDLLQIWALSDPTRKNYFDLSDFIIAMTLIVRKRLDPKFKIPKSRWPPYKPPKPKPKPKPELQEVSMPVVVESPVEEKKSSSPPSNQLLNIGDVPSTTLPSDVPVVRSSIPVPGAVVSPPNPRVEGYINPEVQALLDETKVLKGSGVGSKDVLQQYQAKMLNLKKRANELKKEVEEEKSALKELRNERLEVRKEARELSVRVSLLENEVDYYHRERELLKDTVYDLERIRNENINTLERLNTEKHRYERDLANERDHSNELEREISLLKEELKSKDTSSFQTMSKELKEIQDLNDEKQVEISKLRNDITQMDEKIDDLKMKVDEALQQQDDYTHRVEESLREKKVLGLTILDYQQHLEESMKFMKKVRAKEKKQKKKIGGETIFSKMKKYLKLAKEAIRKYEKYCKGDKFFVEVDMKASTPIFNLEKLPMPQIKTPKGKIVHDPLNENKGLPIPASQIGFSSMKTPPPQHHPKEPDSATKRIESMMMRTPPTRSTATSGSGFGTDSMDNMFDQMMMDVSTTEDEPESAMGKKEDDHVTSFFDATGMDDTPQKYEANPIENEEVEEEEEEEEKKEEAHIMDMSFEAQPKAEEDDELPKVEAEEEEGEEEEEKKPDPKPEPQPEEGEEEKTSEPPPKEENLLIGFGVDPEEQKKEEEKEKKPEEVTDPKKGGSDLGNEIDFDDSFFNTPMEIETTPKKEKKKEEEAEEEKKTTTEAAEVDETKEAYEEEKDKKKEEGKEEDIFSFGDDGFDSFFTDGVKKKEEEEEEDKTEKEKEGEKKEEKTISPPQVEEIELPKEQVEAPEEEEEGEEEKKEEETIEEKVDQPEEEPQPPVMISKPEEEEGEKKVSKEEPPKVEEVPKISEEIGGIVEEDSSGESIHSSAEEEIEEFPPAEEEPTKAVDIEPSKKTTKEEGEEEEEDVKVEDKPPLDQSWLEGDWGFPQKEEKEEEKKEEKEVVEEEEKGETQPKEEPKPVEEEPKPVEEEPPAPKVEEEEEEDQKKEDEGKGEVEEKEETKETKPEEAEEETKKPFGDDLTFENDDSFFSASTFTPTDKDTTTTKTETKEQKTTEEESDDEVEPDGEGDEVDPEESKSITDLDFDFFEKNFHQNVSQNSSYEDWQDTPSTSLRMPKKEDEKEKKGEEVKSSFDNDDTSGWFDDDQW